MAGLVVDHHSSVVVVLDMEHRLAVGRSTRPIGLGRFLKAELVLPAPQLPAKHLPRPQLLHAPRPPASVSLQPPCYNPSATPEPSPRRA